MQKQDIINALHLTAGLMAADEKRTRDAYGSPVGIPVSMAARLIWQACADGMNPSLEWVRRAREESLEAANAWSEGRSKLEHRVFDLLFPNGARSSAVTADEVRAAAAELADSKP